MTCILRSFLRITFMTQLPPDGLYMNTSLKPSQISIGHMITNLHEYKLLYHISDSFQTRAQGIYMQVMDINANRTCTERFWWNDIAICVYIYVYHYNDVIMSAMASQITSLTIVFYSIVCSGTDERKNQSSASLAFVRGIHQWPVNSPHKGPVTRKTFQFDDVIMCMCLLIPQQLHIKILINKRLWCSFSFITVPMFMNNE